MMSWFHHREREVARTVDAFHAALSQPEIPNPPPPVQPRHAAQSVAADGSAAHGGQGRIGPRPWRPDGRPITDYPDFKLVKLMRWIMSDGQLRTTEELVALGAAELGFERRGVRIVSALERAIATVKRSQ